MLDHGGGITAAAGQFDIPRDRWLDLSTGINPIGWPVPPIPEAVWQRLPEDGDTLEQAARNYYGAPRLLAMAGSQAAIQLLPSLRAACRVGILSPGYAEHPYNWERQGHTVERLDPAGLDAGIDRLDVVVLCRPNNPDGTVIAADTLKRWRQSLARRGGWLVIDEAFVDTVPALSLSRLSDRPGLIVLRSPGKFFGLAGLRLGFMLAEPSLLAQARELAGPWAVSHPARWVGSRALADRAWQQAVRARLSAARTRLDRLLAEHGLPVSGGTDLFRWLPHPRAAALQQQLATQGILARHFEQPPALRLGLPGSEPDWQRLAAALANLC